MGTFDIPLLLPVILSVSASISLRTSSKSTNFLPLQCKNSAYSENRKKKKFFFAWSKININKHNTHKMKIRSHSKLKTKAQEFPDFTSPALLLAIMNKSMKMMWVQWQWTRFPTYHQRCGVYECTGSRSLDNAYNKRDDDAPCSQHWE